MSKVGEANRNGVMISATSASPLSVRAKARKRRLAAKSRRVNREVQHDNL